MNMTELSYWAATSKRDQTLADAPLPDALDCAIIGGGYTGLSAGYHLAKNGLKVAVLEREHIGWGASGRNGGMVLPGYKAELHGLMRRYGVEKARELYDHSVASIELVKTLVREEKIACDLEETGSIYAAFKPAHYRSLVDYQRELAHDFNHETRLIPRERQSEELGSDFYHGLLVNEAACGLHPAKFVGGLASAARRAGALLCENVSVERVRRSPDGFEVVTARGTVKSREVIVATNGYTGGAIPWLQRRVVPVGSYIIATEPLDPDLAHRLIPKRRMVFDTKNMLYYWRVLPDNRLMFGGRASFTPTTAQRSGELLRKGMLQVYPELKTAKIEYSWGGTLGFTLDLMPHTGRHDGIFYALGYGGHGVAFSTYLGKKLAEVIAGQSDRLPLQELAFYPIPLYQGWPWFLPLAGAYYELLDRIS
jgi:glycine/D-amino acid oxidase-like deaminating enzyme